MPATTSTPITSGSFDFTVTGTMAWYTKGGNVVIAPGGGIADSGAGGNNIVSVSPFTVTVVGGGTAVNGSQLLITRSSGTFAAKSFGSGAPQLFDTIAHQYLNGVDQNAYSGFADGATVAHQIYGRVSQDVPPTTDTLKYSTSRGMRTAFDSALYSGTMVAGKTCVGRPSWPGAYGTQTNQQLYVSFWGRCSAPLQGTGGGDGSCKLYRITSGSDDTDRSGNNTNDSAEGGYFSNAFPNVNNPQPSFETYRSGNANIWYRHEIWLDNTSGGDNLSTSGNLINTWTGTMGNGQKFLKFNYSGSNSNQPFEACHPVDCLYATNTQSTLWWDTVTGGFPFSNVIINLMGFDDGHGLSVGTIYDIAQVYYDNNFERFELSDASVWDSSHTSTMNREIQGLWTRDSTTQCTPTVSQGQFSSLSGKYLWYLNRRNTAEQVCRFT